MLLYLLIGFLGVVLGFLLHWFLIRMRPFEGTIVITQTNLKTLYSIELNGDPADMHHCELVKFKVDTKDLRTDRE